MQTRILAIIESDGNLLFSVDRKTVHGAMLNRPSTQSFIIRRIFILKWVPNRSRGFAGGLPFQLPGVAANPFCLPWLKTIDPAVPSTDWIRGGTIVTRVCQRFRE